jgi:peptide/nickel transport system permease protein
MRVFVVKRMLALIPVLFILSIIVFLLIYLIPGDPALVMLGDSADPAMVEQLQEEMGLNLPLFQQYLHWIGGVLQGDFGQSYFLNESVISAILEHLKPTLSLAVLAQVIALLIAIPFGIWGATRRGEYPDKALTVFSIFGITIPGFLLSMFLVLFFSVYLKWLPVSGYAELNQGLWEHLKYLILPAISIGVVLASVIARITRSSMLEVLNEGYIKTARSKGVIERKIIYKHVLRNALIPILTVIGGTFGTLVAGAAVVETIFNIPGLGQMLVNSVTRRDYPVIQGIVLFIAFIYVMVNLIVDLLYAVVDPRVRFNKG